MWEVPLYSLCTLAQKTCSLDVRPIEFSMDKIVSKKHCPPHMQNLNKNIAYHAGFHFTSIFFTSTEFKSRLNKYQRRTEHPVDEWNRCRGLETQGKRSPASQAPIAPRRLAHPIPAPTQSNNDSLTHSHILPPIPPAQTQPLGFAHLVPSQPPVDCGTFNTLIINEGGGIVPVGVGQ